MGVAALILGILGLILSWIPVVGWFGVVLAVVSLGLGLGATKQGKKGLGIPGVFLAVVALGFGLCVQIKTVMAVKEVGQQISAELKKSGDLGMAANVDTNNVNT